MNEHKETNQIVLKNWQAESLLKLVKEHKQKCDGQCGISLYVLFPLYHSIKGDGAIKDMEHFV